MNMRSIVFVGLAVVLMAVGYGWFDYATRHGEAALLERAQKYWEAIRINDLSTAYYLEAETVNGQLAPDEVKVNQGWGMRLYSFRLGKASIDGKTAEVEMSREFFMNESSEPFEGRTIKDRWTFINNQWYHGTPEKGGSGIRDRGF
jgi:hypothetical protein